MRHYIAIAALLTSCASVPARQPSPSNRVPGCYISCPSGFLSHPQHECRDHRAWLTDISITGGEDVPGDPSESRWFTGLTSFGADYVVRERLKLAGVKDDGSAAWARKYGEVLTAVQQEMGDEARAAYPKVDVLLMTCDSYKQIRCMAKVDYPCAAMPGEPDPLRPDRH